MKTKTLLFILMLFSSHFVIAQSYFPFPSGKATWQVTRCFYFYPPGWYDDHHIDMTGEDTVINSITYKKLYFTNHHTPGYPFDTIYPKVYLGGLREVNKKIFVVSEYLCLDTAERCVYDFNVSGVGDTIYTQFLSPGSFVFVHHIVTGIDSVLVGSNYHHRYTLTDENHYTFEQWTEGLGSSYGLIYASYWMITDNSYDLICFTENNIMEYLNPNPSFGYCQAPLPPGDCEALPTGITVIDGERVKVFPNPAAESITVSLTHDATITSYELTNLLGEKIITKNLSAAIAHRYITIDLQQIPDGVYYLTLLKNREVYVVVKVVKGG